MATIDNALRENKMIEVGTLRVYPEVHGFTELGDTTTGEHLGAITRVENDGGYILEIRGLRLGPFDARREAVAFAQQIADLMLR